MLLYVFFFVLGCLVNSPYFGANTFANALRISVEGQPSIQVAIPVQWTREDRDPPTFVFRILSIQQPNSSVPFQLSPPINVINPENQAGTVFVTFPESGLQKVIAFQDATQEDASNVLGGSDTLMISQEILPESADFQQTLPTSSVPSIADTTLTTDGSQGSPTSGLSLDGGNVSKHPQSPLAIILGVTLGALAVLMVGVYMCMLMGCRTRRGHALKQQGSGSGSPVEVFVTEAKRWSDGGWSSLTSLRDLEEQRSVTTTQFSDAETFTGSNLSRASSSASRTSTSFTSKKALVIPPIVIEESMLAPAPGPVSGLSYADSPVLTPIVPPAAVLRAP